MIPMLMEREPAPVIDVTKPALPKVQACRPEDRATLEMLGRAALVRGAANALEALALVQVAVDLAKPALPKVAVSPGWTLVAVEAVEGEPAPAAPLYEDRPTNVRATYKVGDQVMVRPFGAGGDWYPAQYQEHDPTSWVPHRSRTLLGQRWGHVDDNIRHATAAEVAMYWPRPGKVQMPEWIKPLLEEEGLL